MSNKKTSKVSIMRGAVSLWVEIRPAPGPTCLLIAGAGAISAFWPDSFCDQLHHAGYQVIRYDHRDTGYSSFVDFEREPYTLEDLVDDAVAILDSLGLSRAHWVGHSMGGFLAQLAAIHHPERVLSLTSISSHTASPGLPEPPQKTWQVMLANQPCGAIERDLEGFLKVWRFLNGAAPFDASLAEAYTREIYQRNPRTLPATNHVAIQSEMQDRTPRLAEINPPALVVHGDADPLVPVIGARMTVEAIPNSRLCILPRAGHVFFYPSIWTEMFHVLRDHFQEK